MARLSASNVKASATDMEIFFLGTGTSIPTLEHTPAGLIVKASDRSLLLDIGPGTLSRLYRAGLTYDQIGELLLTHLHPDHTLDFATLLLAFNYAPGAERTAPFQVTGGRDLRDFLQRLITLYPEVAPASFKLLLRQVYRDQFKVGDLDVRSAPTGHTPDSIGYRLDDGKHSLVYSGDATVRGELADLAAGADLLITECSFPSGWGTEEHFNADTVGAIAQQAAVKSLAITHRYPPALEVDLVEQIHRRYTGDVILPHDGLHLTL